MSIYVEILIRSSMDNLWEKTQNPKLHQRWDLRFSEIDYLPRKPGEAQEFLYATRIGGGLRIEGAGESTGERDDASGQRTSALKFWSDDPKSLIKSRFITWYDYRTRFGIIGRIVDRVFFRPLLGWATAWSFDRLRLWLEKGILPEVSRDRAFVYALSRLMIAFVWLYHGLIPKLIYRNADELSMLRHAGIPDSHLREAMSTLGFIEVCFALAFVIFWKSRWPLWFTIIGMISAVLTVGITSPSFLTAAFNPVTLNLSVATLAVIGLLTGTDLPAARNCRRKSPVS